MTETSPVATYSRPRRAASTTTRYWDDRAKQGRPLPWVELRLVDDDGEEVPWDGESTGEIEVRGPWIAARYFNDDSGDEKFDDGWLRTGDIAAVDEHGFVQITDRSKDVIKSGGEWISSVELENELMAHPDVVEAAVIAKPDERWAERPLCCVVLREGAERERRGAASSTCAARVAKWWLPDEFAFIDEVPKTSVGKFDKKVLRGRLAEGSLEGRVQGVLTAFWRPHFRADNRRVMSTAADRAQLIDLSLQGRQAHGLMNGEPEAEACRVDIASTVTNRRPSRRAETSTKPPNGGWHDSDRCHGLEQATDSRRSAEEERIRARAQAGGPPGRCSLTALALVAPGTALAAEEARRATTRNRTNRRTTTTTPATTPSTGTSPSKEEGTPATTRERNANRRTADEPGQRRSENAALHGLRPALELRHRPAADGRRLLDRRRAAPPPSSER